MTPQEAALMRILQDRLLKPLFPKIEDMMHTYWSDNFTYDKETDTFIAEASELFGFDGRAFNIRSRKTNDTRMFLVTDRDFTDDADREFIGWRGLRR